MVDFWYNPSEDKSLDFIRNVARYIEPLTKYINFEPKIVTWDCLQCDDSFKKKNCVSNGKYCGMTHSQDPFLHGKEIIMEGLRQYCIHSLQQQGEDIASSESLKDQSRASMFFEYVKRTHQIYHTRITEKESYQIMSALTINTDMVR